MRKARVQWHREASAWGVESSSKSDYALYWADTWDEAMFLAQLLADPARYIRQAEQRAWAEGHKVGVLQEYFRVPGVPNTYREENQ